MVARRRAQDIDLKHFTRRLRGGAGHGGNSHDSYFTIENRSVGSSSLPPGTIAELFIIAANEWLHRYGAGSFGCAGRQLYDCGRARHDNMMAINTPREDDHDVGEGLFGAR